MKLKVLCVLLLSTVILADNSAEVDTTDQTEISTAEINTTTEAPENPNTEKPCDKSLITQEDLIGIIDIVTNSLSLPEKINDAIKSEAEPVVIKHVQYINTTMQMFTDRPEHLKHILEEVAATRQHVEGIVTKIRKSLAKYPDFIPLFEDKVKRANQVLKKFVHFKKLCDLNCGSLEVEFRSAVTGSASDKYCGSIPEIRKIAQDRLEKFLGEHIQSIHQQVIKVDENYHEKVQAMYDDLKDVGLKQFGHNMYDILNLQDQYHHIKNDLKEFNNDFWVEQLRALNIRLDRTLIEMNAIVEYFAKYCKTCNRIDPRSVPIEYRQRVAEVEQADLFDLLINNKIAEIKNNTDNDLLTIFQELDKILDRANVGNAFSEHVKPIQKEITELTKNEIEAFEQLQIYKLNIDMDLVKKLIANTKELIDALNREYKAIVAIIKDIVH